MNRIIYFSGFSVTVFQWHKNQFLNSYVFDPSQGGLDDFARYLRTSENCPVRILVDVIEEDFRQEHIPHVNYNDRKAVIRRLIERHYRKSIHYVHHKIRGRESTGRKDDRLFYSVLTNPAILAPWLKIIEETGTAVVGIWSLPLVSEFILDHVEGRDGNVLLVSQQVPSNLRQSFFKDGIFEISRTAVVNLEDASVGEYIAEEVEQTSRFLSNQRHIGFDDKLTIHVICNKSDMDEIRNYCEDTPLREYIYHDLAELHVKAGCEDIQESYCSGIYAYLSRKLAFWNKHYGPANIFKFYYQRLVSKSLKITSLLMVIISALVALSLYAEARIVINETAVIDKKADLLEFKYLEELAKYEPELVKAEVMKSSVLLSEKIDSIKRISPEQFLVAMSQVFTGTGTGMKYVQVTSVEWKRTQSIKFESHTGRSRQSSKESIAESKPYRHYAVIHGEVIVGDQELKRAVNEVSKFVNNLTNSELIQRVEIIKIPLDVRSDSSFENEHSANSQSESVNSKNSFELKILLKANHNV